VIKSTNLGAGETPMFLSNLNITKVLGDNGIPTDEPDMGCVIGISW
jgi:hypothetical protein